MEKIIRQQLPHSGTSIVRKHFLDLVSFAFVVLFTYTAASKFMSLEDFSQVISRMPLIGNYARPIAYAIPASELLISLLLIIPATKDLGLKAALLLMVIFTVFLVYMVATLEYLPCQCGGVISRLSWRQHIAFNLAFILAAILALMPRGYVGRSTKDQHHQT